MPHLDNCYAKTDRFTSRTVDGRTVLIPCGELDELDDLFPLNQTASRVWALIDGKKSLEEIAAKVAEEFGCSSGQAQDNVVDFVRKLAEIGSIAPASGE